MVWIIASAVVVLFVAGFYGTKFLLERRFMARTKARRAELDAIARAETEKKWLDKIHEHNRLVARDIARARNQEVADRIAANRKLQAPKPQPSRVVPTYAPAKKTEHRSSYSSSSSSSDDSFSVGLGIATGLSLFDSPSIDTSSPSTPDDFSVGGGDFGGGGASGDW